MKSYSIVILSCLFFMFQHCAMAQVMKVGSCVSDAETGEPLPYVTVYVSGNKGAVTNLDGHFEMDIDADSVLRFSYIGYETLNIRADKVPEKIQMHQLATAINEVVVMSDVGIMKNIELKLEDDFKNHEKDMGVFFNRVTVVQDGKKDMVEDVVVAHSANNLRNMQIASGSYWCEKADSLNSKDKSSFRHSNIHKLMTIGPLIKDEDFWHQFIMPFSERFEGKAFECLYDLSHDVIIDENGRHIYKVAFARTTKKSKGYKSRDGFAKNAIRKYSNRPMMEGVMYISADDFSLLRLDVVIKDVFFNLARKNSLYRTKVNMEIHCDYKHSNGYTEVDNMSFSISDKFFKMYSVVTNVAVNNALDGDCPLNIVPIYEDNLLKAIDMAGQDDIYLKLRNVIKRTEAEERFVEINTN